MHRFPTFCFGPISYYAQMSSQERVVVECHENFQKQTYRNRYNIAGANGILRLAVPIQHGGKRNMAAVQISYDHDWVKQHKKSLESAYRRAPYFEFYEDEIFSLLDEKPKYLLDLNLATIQFIVEKLQLPIRYQKSTEYIREATHDWRQKFLAKKKSAWNLPIYNQVFQEKLNFFNDLSVLDLLFNLGPEAQTYLKTINTHTK